MATNKEAIVVILDVGKHSLEDGEDENSFLEKEKKCLIKLMHRKMFSAKNDEIALVMMGTRETSNELNCNMKGYNNICEAIKLSKPNWDAIRCVEKNIVHQDTEADWLDALIVAMDIIKRETEYKRFQNMKIVLFSTFSTFVNDDNIESVIRGIKDMGIQLVVVNDNLASHDGMIKCELPNKTEYQKINEEIINRIVDETDGYMCGFELIIHNLLKFQRCKTRPWSWNCDLEIGSNIKFQISCLISLKEEQHFKWKTESRDSNMKLTTNYEYYKNGDKIAPQQDDLLKAYMLGSTPIVFDEAMGSSKECTKKGLKCIGFTSKSRINDTFMTGNGSYLVLPKRGQKISEKMFAALYKAMLNLGLVLIATRVHVNGYKRKLVALIPNTDREYPCLTMIELFYADQYSHFYFPPLKNKKNKQTQEQIAVVEKFINCLQDSCDNENKFSINNLNKIGLQYIYETITKRALNPKYAIPTLDKKLFELLNISHKFQDKFSMFSDEIKKLFPLQETKNLGKIQLIRKVGDIPVEPDENASLTNSSNPINENHNKILEVGTLTPAKDFALLCDRGENFSLVSSQIRNIISTLLFKSITDQSEKIVDAMIVFREKAKFDAPWEYNDWLKCLKSQIISSKKLEFWNNIVIKNKIGLIPQSQSDISTIPDVEAENFYNINADVDSNNTVNEEQVDELFEEM